jgi:hypothetical protein
MDGTVRDIWTGLVWQVGVNTNDVDWDVTACDDLSVTTMKPWKLPTIRELETLVDEGGVTTAIDLTWFPDVEQMPSNLETFWSQSAKSGVDSNVRAWAVNFNSGFTLHRQKIGDVDSTYVRCVYRE